MDKNNSDCKNKVAAYIRLSKEDEGNKVESESVSNQREIIREYARKNGFEIYDYYIDDGYSGGNFDRPSFKRMIEDIEMKKIGIVITKDTSRLGREFLETGNYIFKYFPENNIRYIAILENFDTSNPNGVEDIIPFQTVCNDVILRDISRKIKSVRHDKMENGLFVGSTVSYGYKRDKDNKYKFLIDEYSSQIVKRIFDMRINGYTPTMIARTLTDENILPPSVYNNKNIRQTYTTNIWKVSSINHMLENEIYIGTLVQCKYARVNYKSKRKVLLPKEQWIRVENAVPPIISKEVFDEAQKVKKVKKGIKINRYEYLLKGFVYCKECGAKMAVRREKKVSKKKGIQYVPYYCCRTNITYRNGMCSLHFFTEEKLNEIVIERLKILFLSQDKKKLKEIAEKKKSQLINIDYYYKEKERFEREINILNKSIKSLYIDRAKDMITEEEFYNLKSDFEKEKKLLFEKITDINIMISGIKVNNDSQTRINKIVKEFLKLKKPNKLVMSELIKKIEIDKDKNIFIYFNFNIKENIN